MRRPKLPLLKRFTDSTPRVSLCSIGYKMIDLSIQHFNDLSVGFTHRIFDIDQHFGHARIAIDHAVSINSDRCIGMLRLSQRAGLGQIFDLRPPVAIELVPKLVRGDVFVARHDWIDSTEILSGLSGNPATAQPASVSRSQNLYPKGLTLLVLNETTDACGSIVDQHKTDTSKTKLPTPYYSANGITLYHADYRSILPLLCPGSIDTLITDPPYATTNLPWDKAVDWPFFWGEADRLCIRAAPLVLFSSGKFTHDLIQTNPKIYRYELIWEKTKPVGFLSANVRPLRAHENILVFARKFKGSAYHPQMIKGKLHSRGTGDRHTKHYGHYRAVPKTESDLYYPRSILRFGNGGPSLHPTQKPLELMEWLVRTYSPRNRTILDPFAGSGSTLLAARLNGRKAIGIELSESYCEVIAKRLEERGA